jgi:hypothetical protein
MAILEVIKCSKVFLVTNRPFKTQYKVVFVFCIDIFNFFFEIMCVCSAINSRRTSVALQIILFEPPEQNSCKFA